MTIDKHISKMSYFSEKTPCEIPRKKTTLFLLSKQTMMKTDAVVVVV